MNKRIVHSVFEEMVRRFPERLAIDEAGVVLTYAALNKGANALGAALRASGVGRQSVVGVALPASSDYVRSILGIAKAGGIFLPLNLDFPTRYLAQILDKARPGVLIAAREQEEQLRRLLQDFPGQLMVLDEVEEGDVADLDLISQPEDGNYIVFTSGSTGEPKAILGCQQSLSHFIHWEIAEFALGEGTRVSQLAPTTFDVSLRDIFAPLLAGGTLCIPKAGVRTNPRQLLDWLAAAQVTLMHCVPSVFRLLVAQLESREGDPLPQLRQVLLAGEPLYGSDVRRWRQRMGERVELVNLYGPSETTLAKVVNRLSNEPLEPNAIVPIGKPLPNTAVIILKTEQLCSVGEIGEIHIKTPFMSKGYYRDEALTQQHFVQNPLNPEPGDLIYRTGDLGRYLPDRSIEILGRLDRQIKINGIRVELGEIERELRSHPLITQTTVVANRMTGRSQMLVCYYTASELLEPDSLRVRLTQALPGYMVPHFFVQLEKFPLGLNGKVDRKALPRPEELMYEHIAYVAPGNVVEEKLTRIWGEVLGLAKVGVESPLLELGGNSLHAISLIAGIYKAFGVDVGLKDFFDRTTIRQVAELLNHGPAVTSPIERLPDQVHYEISHAQRRAWVLDRLAADPAAYNMVFAHLLAGEVDRQCLEGAFEDLVDRHEVLRTIFVEMEGRPRQQIHARLSLQVEKVDLRAEADPEARARQWAAEMARQRFDLARGPLVRAGLLLLAPSRQLLVFAMHHIVGDNWSLDVMVRDLLHFYKQRAGQSAGLLPELRFQYRDFAAWQNVMVTGEKIATHREYWRQKLGGELPVLELPADRMRPTVQSFAGQALHCPLGEELSEGLVRLGQTTGVGLFAVLVAGVKALIYRYTGQRDLVVGTPVAGRIHPELENQVGYYVNMLPLRDQLAPDAGFAALLSQVGQTLRGALEHQVYPFDCLVEDLEISRDASRSPVFGVVVALHEARQHLAIEGVEFTQVDCSTRTSKFDLTFGFTPGDEGLELSLDYCTDLFDQARMERLAGHLARLFESAVEDPGRALARLDLLSSAEHGQLASLAGGQRPPHRDTLVRLFAGQAAQTPQSLALKVGEQQWTYAELDAITNQLAHHLRQQVQLVPGARVGLFMDRSEWMVIGILGILKAGAAYLPIDSAYPSERVRFLLEDGQVPLVLTRQQLRDKLPSTNIQLLCLDTEWERIAAQPAAAPIVEIAPEDLAYVIYTSGSTGQPKGTLVSHANAARLFSATQPWFNFGPEDVWTLFHSCAFDFSVWEIFGALLHGGRLVVVPYWVSRSPEEFCRLLSSEKVTVLNQTPSAFRVFMEAERVLALPLALRYVIFGGEALELASLRPWMARHGDQRPRLINMYGITETTVHVTYRPISRSDLAANKGSVIGVPLPDLSLYLMDENLQQVAVGIPGEICVGGAGVTGGYLNRPELSAARFVPDPWSEIPGARLYRSGDLGRWLEDGDLEYLGRMDEQVKVRGFRIELGEIEKCLLDHTGVAEALVLARTLDAGARELVAYVVSSASPEALRSHLSGVLPDYMVPAHFVRLARMPLTAHGKVDRRALPAPQVQVGEIEPGAQPRSAEEEVLVRAWEDVLGRRPVGIGDNFFAMGGDSIKAIQIVAKLREKRLSLELRHLFQYPTIAELSGHIKQSVRLADQSPVMGSVPLTPIQRWFFSHFGNTAHHYNQAVLLRATQALDEIALREALVSIETHHDMLRARFFFENGEVIQEVSGVDRPPSVAVVDLRQVADPMAALTAQAAMVQASFDVATGPLVKAVLFRCPDAQRLLIVIHHLVVDGVSWRILTEDLADAYRQHRSGETLVLPAKSDSFKTWAETLDAFSRTEELQSELDYWQRVALAPVDPLPEGGRVGADLFQDRDSFEVIIEEEQTGQLLSQVHTAYRTEIDEILLAGLAGALRQWGGGTRILVTVEGHGRQQLGKEAAFGDLEVGRTVGWFTCEYPLYLDLSKADEIGDQIKVVKESLRQVPSKGLGYGMLKYLAGQKIDLAPSVLFNYQGQFETEFAGGLFTLDEEEAGPLMAPSTRRLHAVEINGMSVGGRLRFSFSYNRQVYTRDAIASLAAYFSTSLSQIAAHCLNTEGSLTPSDIDYEGLDIKALDQLMKVLTKES